jgi:hypothetical protein
VENLPLCPYCGKPPRVYHGASCGKMGDSIECGEDECPSDYREPWPYVEWEAAVQRWVDYAKR